MPRSNVQSGRDQRRPWVDLSNDELLDVRLCDLDVAIEGSWLEEQISRVRDELAAREIDFQPVFWLSDEWFSPDGTPGVALPFFLVHDRLMRLERAQMLEVEGGTRDTCMGLLRHELGHAIDHAYKLSRRRSWQQVFGKSSTPYPEQYHPNPASKQYVQHLDAWYAQSHPDEDFAETFAIWLKPRSDWRKRYAGWPALKKIEYVDQLMRDIAGKPPIVKAGEQPFALSTMSKTLRSYYEAKRERYLIGFPDVYDRDLMRLFSVAPEHRRNETAAAFLTRNRKEIRELVARWTGEYQFTLDQVLKDMIGRVRELKLRVAGSESETLLDFAILLTVHTMHCLYGSRDWHPL